MMQSCRITKLFSFRLSNSSNDNIDQSLAVSQPAIEREIAGTPSDDVLNGSFFRDLIEGDAGNDIISGGLGNDFIEGDEGSDLLNGEFNIFGGFSPANAHNLASFLSTMDRENTVHEQLTDEQIEQLNPENAVMLFGKSFAELDFYADGTLNFYPSQFDSNQLNVSSFLSSNDTQIGGDGNDTLNGGFGSDTQLGGDGNDILNGDDNFGSLFGTSVFGFPYGNDVQIGGSGNDKLTGGAGNDKLNGTGDRFGLGEIDELTGGSGKDTFSLGDRQNVFYSGQNTFDYAVITDFEASEDTIELRGKIADYVIAPTTGDLSPGTGLYLDVDNSRDFTLGTDELIAISTKTFESLDLALSNS